MDSRQNLIGILSLMLLSAGIHIWIIDHAVTPAPDTLRFIWLAEEIQDRGLVHVIRTEADHPFYAVLLALIEPVVRAGGALPGPDTWWLTAQSVSLCCGVLLVVPIYGICAAICGPSRSLWATLAFVSLPVCSRITADGLSEGPFFLIAAAAVWLAVHGLNERRGWAFALCGVATGLAFWVRPEAVLVTVAVAAAVGIEWLFNRSRRGLREGFVAVGLIAAGCTLLCFPYVAIKGRVTSKGSVDLMVGATAEKRSPLADPRLELVPPQRRVKPAQQSLVVAFREVLHELSDAAHYYLVLIAAWAALAPWSFRTRWPGKLVPAVLLGVYFVVLVRLAHTSGYVASRHVLIPVLCILPWAGVGIAMVRDHLSRVGRAVGARSGVFATAVLVCVLAGGAIPKLLDPLHRSRHGHRQAAGWLENHSKPDIAIVDDHAFASFHSQRARYAFKDWARALRDPKVRFVVIETHDLERADSPYAEVQSLLLTRGSAAASFPLDKTRDKGAVVVFEITNNTAMPGRLARTLETVH